jgi:hypothetical protein
MKQDNDTTRKSYRFINPVCFQLANNVYEWGSNVKGAVCCLVQHIEAPDFFCMITAGHLFTDKNSIIFKHYGNIDKQRTVLCNGKVEGDLAYQTMNPYCDFALIRLNNKPNLDLWHKFNHQLYHNNLISPEVCILSNINHGIVKEAFIVDKNTDVEIPFTNISENNGYVSFSEIMLIGSTPDKDTCKTVSQGGDSGACVFHEKTGRLIGLIMGGNNKYTYVVSIQNILKQLNNKYLVI